MRRVLFIALLVSLPLAAQEAKPPQRVSIYSKILSEARNVLVRVPTYVAAGLSLAVAGTAAYFGVRFLGAQSAFDAASCETAAQLSECLRLRDAAGQQALITNVLFVASGVAVLGTALLAYFDLRAHSLREEREHLSLTPVVGPGLAAVTVRGRF